LGTNGYRVNRVNGLNLLVISDQASSFRFDNNDGGLNLPLRELFSRKARSDTQDQVIMLHSEWADFLTKSKADGYDANVAWIASRPWLQLVTPEQIAAGEVDVTRDFVGDTWPVVERGTSPSLPLVAKDSVDHATQESYDHWFHGQAQREEGLSGRRFEVRPGALLASPWGQVGVSGIADMAWNNAFSVSLVGLRSLAVGTSHAASYLTAFHEQSNQDLSKFSTGEYMNPDTTFQLMAGFSKAAQGQMRRASTYQRVAVWAAGSVSLGATAEDVDLDGEPEYLLYNDRIFTVSEAIGGRLVAAWVRDLVNGKVFQVLGNPLSFSGFESELEGAVNVTAGNVGSYRTSALKDWYATGLNSIAYTNQLYSVAAIPGGWRFTSADGKVQKTVTLAAGSDAVSVDYTLDQSIPTLYVRHGFSPHLENLIKQGQSTLSSVIAGSTDVSLINSVPGETVRAYLRLRAGASYNAAAADDDIGQGVTFDTLNMRNQAQTVQVEIFDSSGMGFSLGFETGPTLSTDLDNDTLPDGWETAHGLSALDSSGDNGAAGDGDFDGMDNFHEYVVGTNPGGHDRYVPIVRRVPSGFEVRFGTMVNRSYRVSYSHDMEIWTPLGPTYSGTGSEISVVDDGSQSTPAPTATAQRFYKVEVWVPSA
jgi:hypothetical protein